MIPIDHDRFSPAASLLVLMLLLIIGNGVATLLTQLLGQAMGHQIADLITVFGPESGYSERQFLRLANLLSQFFTFVVPALIWAKLFFPNRLWRSLGLRSYPTPSFLLMGTLFLIAVFVLSQAAYWLNQQLPLPDWASDMEASAGRLVEGLLVMEGSGELLLTILVIAVLPAVGEELVFRGVLQNRLELAFGNPIAAIWVAGLIFSAFHMQFAGLLPRFMLGVGLGYLYYWSGSLWMSVAAHFTINGLQVAAQYFAPEEISENPLDTVNWSTTAVAAVLVAGLSYYLYRQFRNKQQQRLYE